MLITAVNKMTLLDYPGKTAAVIFTAGCNFRCGFCHNPDFVLPEKLAQLKEHFIPFKVVKNFLSKRKGLLDGVTFCGGEPTIHADLLKCMAEVKEMGFLVKLDTNGTNPQVLKQVIDKNLVDYIAMDIKYPEENKEFYGVNVKIDDIKESISLILNSDLDYEFRSTIMPEYHTEKILKEMGKMIKGAKKWALQKFRTKITLNPDFAHKSTFSSADMELIKEGLSAYVDSIEIRE